MKNNKFSLGSPLVHCSFILLAGSIVMLLFMMSTQAFEGWTQMTTAGIIQPKKKPLTALQMLQELSSPKPQAAVYNFDFSTNTAINKSCPFIIPFQTIPTIPSSTDVPTDTMDNLQNFNTTFQTAITNLKTFLTNYSGQITSWKNNNELQQLKNLLTTMNTNGTNYNTVSAAHNSCVTNTPAPTGNKKQSGCNTEVINLINATNALYDSYAKVLNFLNNYSLAPTWASFVETSSGVYEVVRVKQAVGFTDDQGNSQTFTVPVDLNASPIVYVPLTINSIQNFDSNSFVNQINICITYLQNQLQDCYNSINQLNQTLNNLTSKIQSTANAISQEATKLQATPSQSQKIQHDVNFALTLATTIGPTLYSSIATSIANKEATLVLDLEMPAFTVFNVFLDALASLTGSGNDPLSKSMAQVSAQINKHMIADWSDGNVPGAVLYTGGTLFVGIASTVSTLIDTTTNLLSGKTSGDGGSIANPYSLAGL
jgi:hypothetical protein